MEAPNVWSQRQRLQNVLRPLISTSLGWRHCTRGRQQTLNVWSPYGGSKCLEPAPKAPTWFGAVDLHVVIGLETLQARPQTNPDVWSPYGSSKCLEPATKAPKWFGAVDLHVIGLETLHASRLRFVCLGPFRPPRRHWNEALQAGAMCRCDVTITGDVISLTQHVRIPKYT